MAYNESYMNQVVFICMNVFMLLNSNLMSEGWKAIEVTIVTIRGCGNETDDTSRHVYSTIGK